MDTEASILANIPDLDDNSPDTSTDDTTTNTATNTAPDTTTTTTTTDGGTDSGSSTTNTPTEPPVVVRKHDGLIEKQSTTDPRAKDLVDPATGIVVAHGGIERRVFETAQKVHRENTALQARVTAAEGQVANASELNKLGTTLGLSHADQSQSLQLMAQFLKDPVKALEALVIEVKSKGYEIPFLATGITPGMDTAAINRMLDQRMAPITEARQQQEQAAQAQANAKATLDTFLDANQEASHNLSVLAEMITAQPGLSLNDAYVKMIKFCAANGLDYSQPLKPQIEARTQQPATTTAQTTTPPRTPVAPLPNGRSTNTAAPIDKAATFDENSSWSAIIKQSMIESGMSVS